MNKKIKDIAPLAGLIVGALWALCYYLLSILMATGWFPHPIAAGVLVAAPLVITGCTHLHGFMNCSYDKTVSTVFLFLSFYAAALSLDFKTENFLILVFLPIIMRCCGRVAITVMPTDIGSEEEKYQKNVDNSKLAFWIVSALIAALLGTIITKFYGLAIVAGLNGFFLTLMHAYRKKEGVSEEVVDYAIISGEAWAFVMFALVGPFVEYFTKFILAF